MQAGCRRFDSVWLHQAPAGAGGEWPEARIANGLSPAGKPTDIDIVKEELDRLP